MVQLPKAKFTTKKIKLQTHLVYFKVSCSVISRLVYKQPSPWLSWFTATALLFLQNQLLFNTSAKSSQHQRSPKLHMLIKQFQMYMDCVTRPFLCLFAGPV